VVEKIKKNILTNNESKNIFKSKKKSVMNNKIANQTGVCILALAL